MTRLFWHCFIDWDGDGESEINESWNLFNFYYSKGRDRMLNYMGRGWQIPKVGKLTLELWNDSLRFDATYTSGALYPNVQPGRRVELGVAWDTVDSLLTEAGETIVQETGAPLYYNDQYFKALFVGHIDDIEPYMTDDGRRAAKITVLDGWRTLRDVAVYVDLMESTDTPTAMDAVLDDADWPAADRVLNGDGDSIDYFWVSGDSASAALWELAESNLGQVYLDGRGRVVFDDRVTLQGVSGDYIIDESDALKKMDTPSPWELLRNYINITIHPRELQTNVQAWILIDKPLIYAGESVVYWADFFYEGRPAVAQSITDPVATTDYTMNTLENGTGDNLTADFSVAVTVFGQSAKVTVTNNGEVDGYITLLKIRGNLLDSPNTTTIIGEDTDSQVIYKKRALMLDLKWAQDSRIFRDMTLWTAYWLGTVQESPSIYLVDQPNKQFGDLMEVVDLTAPTIDVDRSFQIGGVELESMAANLQLVKTKYTLEPISALYWIFTTRIGESSRFGY